MRAVRLVAHGGLDRLVYSEDVPVPEPAPGEVLIEVAACGVNNTDINTRVGWYSTVITEGNVAQVPSAPIDGAWGAPLEFPRVQGADVVGRIAAHGTGVATPPLGTRVMVDPWLRGETRADTGYLGSERDGGFAEYVAVPAHNAHPVSSSLSDVELATFPCSYSTAEHMCERAGVGAEQRILVSGASGGVGTGLVQIARARGASVVALAGPSKLAGVQQLGADVVIDRTSAELAAAVHGAGPFDVFADVVGGVSFPELFEAITPGGTYVVSGAVAGPVVDLDLRSLYLRDLTMHGATVVPPHVFAKLLRRIEAGELQPVVAGTYPLDQVATAQTRLSERRHIGSFVVEMN